MKKIRIALYMRLSKEDESMAEESNSITNQRMLLKKYSMEHFKQYELQEFIDDGFSGTNFNRPGVMAMLGLVKEGKIDCIIVKDFSRFSRDYIELGSYMEQIFPFLNIRFISVSDQYDSENYKGCITELDINFKSLMYDLYSKDLSVKVKSALKAKKENGNYVSAVAPFGYQKSKTDRHILLKREEEAEIVQNIFELTRRGMTSNQIARLFNKQGIKTPMQFRVEAGETTKYSREGKFVWNHAVICEMLRNEVYVGDMVYGKYEKKEVGGKTLLKPRNQWKIYRDHHEPIISRELFELVQQSGSKKRKHTSHPKHPLTGKLICGYCGRTLILRLGTNPYFDCVERYNTEQNNCVEKVSVIFLEQVILCRIKQEVVIWKEYKQWQDNKRKQKQDTLNQLTKEKRKKESELFHWDLEKRMLYERYVVEGRKSIFYKEEAKTIEEKKAKLLEEIKNLEAERKKCEDELLVREEKYLSEAGFSGYLELNKELVDTFISKIVVYQEQQLEISWKFKILDFVLD